ncbi:universal stress protein [Kaistella antarctica]|nr:universal stress protein [Kaistella antarctica]SEW05363.1 Nucleotide-binding universal stress protein, UspA family [Kaistella antarctica]VEH98485.1 Putative universal stress protein SAV1710 [Kaistella antarctica]
MKTEIKTIVLPTDFSNLANNALNVAAEMAKRHQAKLIVVHTINTYYMVGRGGKQVIGSELIQENMDLAKTKLDELQTNLNEKYNLDLETKISTESIVDSINDLILTDQVDLVVMGTSGEQNVKRFILGSNSYNVLLNANCSILLIPESFKKTSFKRILFPVRVKHELDQKADLSILLADKNNGDINLLGVGDIDQMVECKKDYIEMKNTLSLNSAEYESEFQLSHDNAEIIAKAAIEKQSDIIILADEDEDSWKSFMADNFFKKMINSTDIPLLIVKSKLDRLKNNTDRDMGYDLTMPIPG